MNCKPGQMAWIVVPRSYNGSGLEQLNNRVVKTLGLAPGYPVPTWRVTPRQHVTFTLNALDHSGTPIRSGETKWTEDIPDAFLRPFDPNSEPEAEPMQRALDLTS